jgi:hypothetical protein
VVAATPWLLAALAVAAAAGPSLLAFNVSPSPTFLNQALALLLWGGFVLPWPLLAPSPRLGCGRAARGRAAVQGRCCCWRRRCCGRAPRGLAGRRCACRPWGCWARPPDAVHGRRRRCAPAAKADALRAVLRRLAGGRRAEPGRSALVQVFAPEWPDGDWIAAPASPGRAVGNLRQPNHLSSLLLWSAIAAVALLELRRLPSAAGHGGCSR